MSKHYGRVLGCDQNAYFQPSCLITRITVNFFISYSFRKVSDADHGINHNPDEEWVLVFTLVSYGRLRGAVDVDAYVRP
jgi:hypothetical protein